MRFAPSQHRLLMLAFVTASVFCAISMFAIDGPLALAAASLQPDTKQLIRNTVAFIEKLFAFGISVYLYGLILIAAGLIALRIRRDTTPWALLFVGLSHVASRFLADILKPPFSRLRPFEALTSGGWHDLWFAPVGNSFPSGHAVHFWSLFFPLALLFPKWRWPLAVLPILISAARVAVNDHYLSDVIASAALAALLTWSFARLVLSRDPTAESYPTEQRA